MSAARRWPTSPPSRSSSTTPASKLRVLNDQLTQALQSRIVIEQAKGVLAEAAHLGMGDALERLRGYARSHNLRLTEVAQVIVDRRPFRTWIACSGKATATVQRCRAHRSPLRS